MTLISDPADETLIDYEKHRPFGGAGKQLLFESLQKRNFVPHQDYSNEVWRKDEVRMIRFIEEETKFTEEYKTLLVNLFRHTYQVNPTKYGNVGRTAGHSCVSNCELLRVYQKSLSPAHINLVMVSLEDIVPGTPITIDYGKQYAERLKNVCGCGTFYCQNGEDKKKFEKMGYLDIALCLERVHSRKFGNYWENVQSRFTVDNNFNDV